MRRLIKEWIRSTLAKRNILIRGYSPIAITGIVLERDLRVLIPKPDPLCLDIGANMGQTIEMLQRVFPNPQIYAFEPSSSTFAQLQAKRYGEHVRLFNLALGEQEDEREFINYQSSDLSSFLPLNPAESNIFRDTPVVNTERVKVQTVDGFLAAHTIPHIDLLKIDTQGYDYQVLQGASDSLRRGVIHAILVEFNFSPLYQGEHAVTELIDFLASHNVALVDLYVEGRYETNKTISWGNALFARR